MIPPLGKRKRRVDVETDHTSNVENVSSADLRDLIQQHFESTFEPLSDTVARSQLVHNNDNEPSDEELESDWNGFSDYDEEPAETVDYATSTSSKADISKNELKTFMSTRPPSLARNMESAAKKNQHRSTDKDESSTDAANLKKDLALQRLLKESHLLDPNSSLLHSGQNRHRALDLRLQDMGSKTSLFTQQKMPLAQRKGIAAKAAKREENRRKEAKENGIILEKEVKRKKKDDKVRSRGIGAPSVGRFQGGMLKLSTKDVAKIEVPRKLASRKR